MLRPTPTASSARRATKRATQRRTAINVAIGLLVAAVVGVVIWEGDIIWEGGLKDRATSKNLGLVEPGLWRSGQISPHAIGPTLNRIDADLIVSLSHDNPENAYNMAEFRTAKRMGIRREHVNLSGDGTGDPQEYVKALTHIIKARREGQTVLFHCWAGSERTSGTAALYRTLVLGHDADEAVSVMDDYGHEFDEGVLIDYLNENVAFIANGLKENGLLEEVPNPLPHFNRP